MTTIIEDSGQSALHLPPLLDDLNTLPCSLYDLQVNLVLKVFQSCGCATLSAQFVGVCSS